MVESLQLENRKVDTLFFARRQLQGTTTVLIVSLDDVSPDAKSARSRLFIWYNLLAASAISYASYETIRHTSII